MLIFIFQFKKNTKGMNQYLYQYEEMLIKVLQKNNKYLSTYLVVYFLFQDQKHKFLTGHISKNRNVIFITKFELVSIASLALNIP